MRRSNSTLISILTWTEIPVAVKRLYPCLCPEVEAKAGTGAGDKEAMDGIREWSRAWEWTRFHQIAFERTRVVTKYQTTGG